MISVIRLAARSVLYLLLLSIMMSRGFPSIWFTASYVFISARFERVFVNSHISSIVIHRFRAFFLSLNGLALLSPPTVPRDFPAFIRDVILFLDESCFILF